METARGPKRPAIYLDWNATTPPHPVVLAAMMDAAARAWANPASIHGHGRAARAVVEDARAAVAALGGAGTDPRDVVFTSGGTEANNLVLRSAFADGRGGVLVTSRLEHPSVTRVAEALEREGRARVHWLAVGEAGAVDPGEIEAVLAAGGVRLVAVQAVNHETGVVQPVDAVLLVARNHGVAVHVDAVQAFGRLAATGQGADSRSLAAHKLRGPKGLGALLLAPGVRLSPLMLGGAQEKGLRPGTVDPVAAAGLAAAVARVAEASEAYQAVSARRDRLEAGLLASWPAARINGAGPGPCPRAPHVTNVSFVGASGPELVAALDLEGVSVSSGSACSAGTIEASPVLEAMVGPARAASGVRLSLGEDTTDGDVDGALDAFRRVLGRLAV